MSRFHRDGFFSQGIPIPTAIHFFMVVPYRREDAAKRLERRAHSFSNHRMLLHNPSFFRIQRTGFKKNAFWHVNFPYVMKPTRNAEFLQVFFTKTETLSQFLCACHHPV